MAALISVVVPTCRRPDLLARCLDQLAPGAQTLPAQQYEVVVTDDGVPTAEQLLREKYPWARWVQGPRKGPAANRNCGANKAKGDWLAFTDDDCVPDPGWLAAFTRIMHSGCDAYEGKTTCKAGVHSPLQQAPVNLTGGYLWSCNMLLRRTAFMDLRGFDEGFPFAFMEDVDFRERLQRAGLLFEFVPDATVDHPPRPVASGWRLAKQHASQVRHWYRSGHRRPYAPRLLFDLVRVRLRTIFAYPASRDSAHALASLAIELIATLPRLPLWEIKYWRPPSATHGEQPAAHRHYQEP